MIITLMEELEFQVAPSVGVKLDAYSTWAVLNYYYIPQEAEFKFPGIFALNLSREFVEDNYFVIYFKSYYLALPKNSCDIPKSIGWRSNL